MSIQQKTIQSSVSRRSFLEIGSLAMGSLTLPDLLRLRAAAKEANTANQPTPNVDTSVIVLWLQGGPSQYETYDPKPAAPKEIRGEFQPVATSVPGIDICELLPRHTKIADRFTLIRSISHEYSDHGRGTWRMLTGRNQPQQNIDGPPKYPEMGTLINLTRQNRQSSMPNFVVVGKRIFRRGYAYLGPAFAPLIVGASQDAQPDFRVQNLSLLPQVANRLDDRLQLLQNFDQLRRDVDHSGLMNAMDRFHQQAMTMLTSEKVHKAFDLSDEPASIRKLYSHHKWGQRALLARRLVEAGCSIVHVVMSSVHDGGKVGTQTVNWDDHGNGSGVRRNIFVSMKDRLPVLDRIVTALIEDIYSRGLDKKVMVVVAGEFGRSPKIYNQNPQGYPGREHWSRSMSVLVSGGDTKTGQVIGSTTKDGGRPNSRHLDPNNLLATIYQHLGINQNLEVGEGQETRILPYGRPIAEL